METPKKCITVQVFATDFYEINKTELVVCKKVVVMNLFHIFVKFP